MECSLDKLAAIHSVTRDIYGYDEHDKPNEHCTWQSIGFVHEIYAWVETDKHFKERLTND